MKKLSKIVNLRQPDQIRKVLASWRMTRFTRTEASAQLITHLWTVADVSLCEDRRWYWRTSVTSNGENDYSGYAHNLVEAMAAVDKSLESDCLYQYEITGKADVISQLLSVENSR